jgi:putative SbcD/Mre11-related phosphoesterase
MKDIRTVVLKEVIPFNGIPAVYIPSLNATVISDLHLGYEEELVKKGILLKRTQLEEIIKEIDKIQETINTKKLIINGDIRHGFGKITNVQKKELEIFLLHAFNYYETIIAIRGNHDNYLKPILKNFGIELLEFFYEKGILILHGHKEQLNLVKDSEIIIIGHEHPALLLKDNNGQYSKFLSFLFLPTILGNVLVILPPFSKYAGGNIFNKENLLSEITKKYALIEEGIPFVLYEDLGTVELPKLSLLINS